MREYDEALVKEISRECGSRSIRNSLSYFGVMRYRSPETFWYDFHGTDGYYVANRCRKHARLVGIAVRGTAQRGGIGTELFARLVARARAAGLERITFRTSTHETAVDFYSKIGCRITGLNGEDYEMEYIIK